MKTRILSLVGAVVAAVLLSMPSTVMAGATTTLLSQDFSGSTFPPSGWTANSVTSANPNTGPVGVYWYRCAYGLNGADGSAVAWTGGGYNYDAYGYPYSGYANGPLSLATPTVACSSADSQYVDFDLFYPEGGYMNTYIGMKTIVNIMAGSTVLKTLSSGDAQAGDATFSQTSYYAFQGCDPSNFQGTSYWRHYHLALPKGTSQTVTFQIMHGGSTTYQCWYTDNIAFDNVVITDISFNVLTVVGPTTLSFSNQPLFTQSASQYVKIKNTANRLFPLTNYLLAGASPSQFVITRAPASIAVGATDSVGFAYAPTLVGSKSATGQFTAIDDANSTPIITLNGFGVAPQIGLPPNLTLFTKTHARMRQTITQSFAVTAIGTVPLNISPYPATYIGGDYPNDYTITRLPTKPIAPGTTDTVTVVFTAMIEGSTSGTLFLASNASNGTQAIPLHGVGVLPRLVIDGVYNPYSNSISLDFDSVDVGTQKCVQASFYNPGTDSLFILKNFLSSKDYDFSITPLSGTDTILPPQTTKMMNICFTPLRNGYRTATLRVATNIPITFPVNPPVAPNTFGPDTSGFSLIITGTGVPFGSLAITGITGDSVATGTQICMKDTIWNTGSASVSVTGAMLTGGDSSMFTFSGLPSFPFSLGANAFAAFEVCGTPATVGLHQSLFSAAGMTGDAISVSAPFPVSVFGLNQCDSLAVVTPFPAMTCTCGMGDTATVSVINCGDVATSYTATITGANASDYTIVSALPTPLETAGGMATVKVAYMPKTRGASVATLNIGGGPAASWALTGMGGAPNIAGTVMAPITAPGATSAPFTVTVTNTGECDWTPGTPMLMAGSAFKYTGAPSEATTPIAAGKTGTFTFTFDPSVDGPVNETVTFPTASCASIPAAAVTLTAATAGVQQVTAQLGYSIEQNFPNPFNNETSISMTLPQEDFVKLTIIDQKGEIVQTLLNQRMSEGTFNVTVHSDELASGTYYYQMSTSSVTLTRQMVVVK